MTTLITKFVTHTASSTLIPHNFVGGYFVGGYNVGGYNGVMR